MRPHTRHGFTLVELLVVIAIIGILVGLTMPAVNAAREAMRRSSCSNNLYQLSRAATQHEAKYGFLPTGGWGAKFAGDPTRGFTSRQPGGWHYNILPFIEMDALYKQVSTASPSPASVPVAMFVCPTRRKVMRQRYVAGGSTAYVPPITTLASSGIGRSDYAANSGCQPDDVDWKGQGPSSLDQGDKTYDWSKAPGIAANGVVFRRSECKMAMIKKGTGLTYLFGERFLDPDFYGAGTRLDDDQGWDMGYDAEVNRWAFYPPRRDLRLTGITLASFKLPDDSFTWFGSAHASGFNMAFCDCNVRRLAYSLDPVVHATLSQRAYNPGAPLLDPTQIF
jgi:prepilin-type N-terminal cleavage/methylation domain-containing protein/prepilin-type processing-associated H-X9-DG protein